MSEDFRHIIRICSTDIIGTKKLPYGISKIKGVGLNFGRVAIEAVKLDPKTKIGNLSDEDVQKIESVIANPEKFMIPGHVLNRRRDMEMGSDRHFFGAELTLRTKLDIDFLKDMRCWRGVRHSLGLRVRGQKTRTTGRSGRAVGVKKKAIVAAALAEKKGM